MRRWFKYFYDREGRPGRIVGRDSSFEDHAKWMEGLKADGAYTSKADFFNKHFFGYQYGRLEDYDRFFRKRLSKSADILSVASGRAASELFLIENGYKVTCSDMGRMDAYENTKRLFPAFDWFGLNILESPAPKAYDAVICLSLIYLFDDSDFTLFFNNVAKSLKPGGCLILDSAGAPDNLLSFFIHDVWLKFENFLFRFRKFILTGKLPGLIIKDNGFRRTDRDIINAAKKCGFTLQAKEDFSFLVEFRRSLFFNRLVKPGSILERPFALLGRAVPYIRMFDFKKDK